MEKWRKISLIGLVLGNATWIFDSFVKSIPNVIAIPLLFVSIILIFTGLVMRKKKAK